MSNKTQNSITIYFQSDHDTAKRLEHLVKNLVEKNNDGKMINISYVDLVINTH